MRPSQSGVLTCSNLNVPSTYTTISALSFDTSLKPDRLPLDNTHIANDNMHTSNLVHTYNLNAPALDCDLAALPNSQQVVLNDVDEDSDKFTDLPDLIPISDNEDKDFDPSSSDSSLSSSDHSSHSSPSDNDKAPPPPIPLQDSESSSDSDRNPPCQTRSTPCPFFHTMSSTAMIEQHSCTDTPILHPGVYNINIFNEFSKAFDAFFLYKKVKDEDKVLMAVPVLRGPAMKSWIRLMVNQMPDPLSGWMWEHFLIQLKSKWLLDNWFVQVKKTRNMSQRKRTWFNF